MSFDTLVGGSGVGIGTLAALPMAIHALPDVVPAGDAGPARVHTFELSVFRDESPAGRLETGAGVWIECDERQGVVEIHDPRLFRPGREAFCRALTEAAVDRFRALGVQIDLTSSVCRLEFRPGEFDRAGLARRVVQVVEVATAVMRNTPAQADRPHDDRAGAPRLADLALAGGSLAIAIAGFVLPGVPSLPFLLLATHHAVRVSPSLYSFLRRQGWSAVLIDRVEECGSHFRLDGQSLVKVLPCTVLAAAVLLVAHPPLPVVLGLEIGMMAFVFCQQIGRIGGSEPALALAG
jgi:uncharacterized membrane protein YbaN (DUF454 family)